MHARKKDFVTISVDIDRVTTYGAVMNSAELKRWLAKQGCSFETHKGGSGHLTVILGDKTAQMPMHGQGKELGKGLVNAILKQLGLK